MNDMFVGITLRILCKFDSETSICYIIYQDKLKYDYFKQSLTKQ